MNGDCKIKELLSSEITFMLGVELVLQQQHPVLEGTVISHAEISYGGTIRFFKATVMVNGIDSPHYFFYSEISHIEFKDE